VGVAVPLVELSPAPVGRLTHGGRSGIPGGDRAGRAPAAARGVDDRGADRGADQKDDERRDRAKADAGPAEAGAEPVAAQRSSQVAGATADATTGAVVEPDVVGDDADGDEHCGSKQAGYDPDDGLTVHAWFLRVAARGRPQAAVHRECRPRS
jgi:hypothetical protein